MSESRTENWDFTSYCMFFFISDTKFSTKICQSGAIKAIYPILKHLSGKVGNLYPVLQVRTFDISKEWMSRIFFAWRPFIYNITSAKRWVGEVRKMAIFADFRYYLCWRRVGEWVRKSPKMCWRNIGMDP